MKLSEVGESSLIESISKKFNQSLPNGVLGIGDDCAVLPWSTEQSLLVTTDLLTEGVHFLKDKISPRDLGHKALAVNLSDIAAMGGVPQYSFLSIALPNDIEMNWINSFFSGVKDLADMYGVSLLGGDTTGSLKAITINFTLLGSSDPRHIKLRSSAQSGDLICVTGTLGDSAGGLKMVLDNQAPDSTEAEALLQRHHHPEPHVAEGQWLGQRASVHAMMDVSDGINSDLQRIMEKSNRGAWIKLEKVPLSQELRVSAQKQGWNALEMAALGGEDYCLLLTVDRDLYPEVASQFKNRFGKPLYEIGEVTHQREKLKYTLDGSPYTFGKSGFDHFRNVKEG